MSEYGLELTNNYGKALVNSKYKNFIFRSSGTLTNSDFSSDTSRSKACRLVIDQMNNPIIFLIPKTNYSRVTVWNKLQYIRGNSLSMSRVFQLTTWFNLTVDEIQYYVFDQYVPKDAGEYGFKLLSESSDVIFDSNWSFLKILNVHWLDSGFPTYSNGESNWLSIGSFNAGKKIAAAMPYARNYIIQTGLESDFVFAEGFWLNPSTNEIRVSLMPIGELLWPGNWGGYIQKSMRSQIMICDIEGLPTSFNSLPIIT